MNGDSLGWAGALITAVLTSGAVSALISKRVPEVETDAARLRRVEQASVERERVAEERVDRLERRLDAAEEEIAELKGSIRLRDDYIGVLRRHIDDGKVPPPPPWPPGLIA